MYIKYLPQTFVFFILIVFGIGLLTYFSCIKASILNGMVKLKEKKTVYLVMNFELSLL